MNIQLRPQTVETTDGLLVVTYAPLDAPADVQDMAFAAHGLHPISPAEKGYLMANINDSPFTPYSRTDMDIFYDNRGDGQVVLARGRPISQLFLYDLVRAHRDCKEFIIPEDKRKEVYATIDSMLRNGRAFATTYGEHRIPVSELATKEIIHFMFSDTALGISAADYTEYLDKRQINTQRIFFGNKEYARSQRAPYLNMLRVCGPGNDFLCLGGSRSLGNSDGCAFGVLIQKTVKGGAKKQAK